MSNRPKYTNAFTETVFVLLPICVVVLLFFIQGNISRIYYESDLSLAVSIMYGQLLSKTLSVSDSQKNSEKFRLFQVLIFAFSIIAIVLFAGIKIMQSVEDIVLKVQLIIFVIAVFLYVPFASVIDKLNQRDYKYE